MVIIFHKFTDGHLMKASSTKKTNPFSERMSIPQRTTFKLEGLQNDKPTITGLSDLLGSGGSGFSSALDRLYKLWQLALVKRSIWLLNPCIFVAMATFYIGLLNKCQHDWEDRLLFSHKVSHLFT